MNKQSMFKKFKEKIKEDGIFLDEAMKNHTSFKIGGPVDILIVPTNTDEISHAIKVCKDENIDYMIIGNGSNLLVKDKGIRGVIIKINDNLSDIKVNDNKIIIQAGALLSTISKSALKASLSGFEFAGGIPGTIGGAVNMNAGAYGGEMKDVVESVTCLDRDGNILNLNNKEMNFGYRTSKVEEEKLIVLEVEIGLEKANYDEIKAKMTLLNEKRTSKQPLSMPSSGSTFKRPEGHYAAQLIEESGLKGKKYGDAQVSEKHAGFVVNLGKATSEDVLGLINIVKTTVLDRFNVELETEVKIIGED